MAFALAEAGSWCSADDSSSVLAALHLLVSHPPSQHHPHQLNQLNFASFVVGNQRDGTRNPQAPSDAPLASPGWTGSSAAWQQGKVAHSDSSYLSSLTLHAAPQSFSCSLDAESPGSALVLHVPRAAGACEAASRHGSALVSLPSYAWLPGDSAGRLLPGQKAVSAG